MFKKRFSAYTVAASVFVLSAAGAALAEEVVEPDEPVEEEVAEETETTVTPTWDDENGVVVVSVSTDGEDPCADVTYERNDEGELVVSVGGVEGADLPAGCIVGDGVGPNGQVNHGTMVSSVAKHLSPHDLPGPKGHVIRELAKFAPDDFTKKTPKDAVEDGDGDGDGDGEVAPSRSGKGKGQGKGKAKGKNK